MVNLRDLFNFASSGIKFLIGPREMLAALQSVTAQNGDRVGKDEVCFDSWGDKICDNVAQEIAAVCR